MNDAKEHEFVISINDEESNLKAFVAIHSSRLGPAHGGTRMKKYKSEQEAIKDVLDLSKAMSYKSALASLPYGGAKAVIMLPSGKYNRKQLLKAYAEKIEKLQGLFHTGTDVGLTDEDVIYMSDYCQYILGLPKSNNTDTTSSSAAKGVYIAIKAAANHMYKSEDLKELVVGIKGLGKLGGELGEMLYRDGAKLIIADIDTKAVSKFVKRHPNVEVVDHNDINSLKMDIYAPCALGQEFNKNNVKDLKCEIIVGGANNQLASVVVGDMIYKNSITYVPDYVANAGGLIFVCEDLEKGEYSHQRVEQRLNGIAKTVESILDEANKKKVAPHRIADIIAKRRIEKGI